MFHIVKQKNPNAYDMRGIFIYLFLKSFTRESISILSSIQNRNQSTIKKTTAQ